MITPAKVSSSPVPAASAPVVMLKNSGTAVTSRTAKRMPVRVTMSSRVIERVRTGDGMPYWGLEVAGRRRRHVEGGVPVAGERLVPREGGVVAAHGLLLSTGPRGPLS